MNTESISYRIHQHVSGEIPAEFPFLFGVHPSIQLDLLVLPSKP